MIITSTSLSITFMHLLYKTVDFSLLPDVLPDVCSNHPHEVAKALLPSFDDDRALQSHFITHISRILCSNIHFFKFSFDNTVAWQ